MNRLHTLFKRKEKDIISVYFTAGYPRLKDTAEIICALDQQDVDIIEIGIPFSDPMADGPVIQESNSRALKNGMSLSLLLKDLKNIRKLTDKPLVLMGYFNPILRFGFEKFCQRAQTAGVDALIIPDLPPEVYREYYQSAVISHGLEVVFLITPETGEERIRMIDQVSNSFIYAVTSSVTTGNNNKLRENADYFERIRKLNLRNPVLAGFGIKEREDLLLIRNYFHGAIVGSAFIKSLASSNEDIHSTVQKFLKSLIP